MSKKSSSKASTTRTGLKPADKRQSASQPHGLIEEISEATSARGTQASTLPLALLGSCLQPQDAAHPGRCRVRYQDANGTWVEQWTPYLTGLFLQAGDEVLLTLPLGASMPVVVGQLAGEEQGLSLPLPGGRKLVFDAKDGDVVRLEMADGQIVLEIDLGQEVPTVRLPQKDLTLDIEGRLKITARSIDLISRLGNINVKANDDFKVIAERVWLN